VSVITIITPHGPLYVHPSGRVAGPAKRHLPAVTVLAISKSSQPGGRS